MASKILYLGSFETYTPRENSITNLHVSSFKDDQRPLLVLSVFLNFVVIIFSGLFLSNLR